LSRSFELHGDLWQAGSFEKEGGSIEKGGIGNLSDVEEGGKNLQINLSAGRYGR